MIFEIYAAECIINNKKYIGQTMRGVNKRWRIHKYDAKCGSDFLLHKAIRKYGEENFAVSIIDKCNSLNEANCLEQLYIYKFKTNIIGYNLTSGGSSTEFSIEAKQKMQNSAIKRWENNDEEIAAARARGIARFKNEELRKEYSKAAIEQWNSETLRKEHGIKMSKRFNDDTFAEHMRAVNKERFNKNPGLRAKLTEHLKKFRNLPHSPESIKKRMLSRKNNNNLSNSSKYIGVAWYEPLSKWKASGQLNGKTKHIGYFDTEEDAARARDNFVKIHYINKTILNFE